MVGVRTGPKGPKVLPPITKVWWCPTCSGPEGEERLCPKCGQPRVDFGYRVGWHSGAYEYYSTWETIPRSLKS